MTLAVGAVGVVRADAPPWVAFDVVAAADGARVALFVPGGPLNDRVFDGGAPKAQARVDGLGSSTAYAAGAYPDELVLNIPGLASGITGTPLPQYPLIVASSNPTTPESTLDAGVVSLAARSGPGRSNSVARLGAEGSVASDLSVVASSTIDDAGTLEAQAASVTRGVVVGPLSILRITSKATAVQRPGAELTRAASAVVTGIEIEDQAVELGPEGLRVAGTNVPLPADDPAREALAEAGVALRWLAGAETPTGISSPAVEVEVTVPVSLTGTGSSIVTYTFGRATVGIAASPVDRLIVPPLPGGIAGVGGFSGPGSTSLTPRSGGLATGVVETEGPGPIGDAASPVPGAVEPPAAPRPVAGIGFETWSTSFYLVLVGAAVIIVSGALATRTWGVRNLWGS